MLTQLYVPHVVHVHGVIADGTFTLGSGNANQLGFHGFLEFISQ
jgi:hypothetical protein